MIINKLLSPIVVIERVIEEFLHEILPMRCVVGVVITASKAVVENRQAVVVTEPVEQVVPCSFGEAKALGHLAGPTRRLGGDQIVGPLYQYKLMVRKHHRSLEYVLVVEYSYAQTSVIYLYFTIIYQKSYQTVKSILFYFRSNTFSPAT